MLWNSGSKFNQEEILGPSTVSKSAVAPRPISARMFSLCCCLSSGSGMFSKSKMALGLGNIEIRVGRMSAQDVFSAHLSLAAGLIDRVVGVAPIHQ